MKSRKGNRKIIYQGLGFPIIVVNPRYIEFEGEKVLDLKFVIGTTRSYFMDNLTL